MRTDHEEPERHTRRERIDPRLTAQGWGEPVHHYAGISLDDADPKAVTEFPTENGPADYALRSDGCVLAVVEAKKVSLGPLTTVRSWCRDRGGSRS